MLRRGPDLQLPGRHTYLARASANIASLFSYSSISQTKQGTRQNSRRIFHFRTPYLSWPPSLVSSFSLSHVSNPATAGPQKREMASSSAAPSSQKPAIIIVHGAWSLPSPSYEPLKQQLEGLGYECYLPHLRTSGGDEVRGQTWEADVQVILDTAQPLFDRGREVVIVAHSYGGVPGGAATAGNGVADRARQGKAGGFRQIIYVAAFAIPAPGMDLFAVFGGQWPPWADFAPAYSKVRSYGAVIEPRPFPVLFLFLSICTVVPMW